MGSDVTCAEELIDADEQLQGEPQEMQNQDLSPKELVLERAIAAHEAWFDIKRSFHYAGRTFPAYAEFHSHGEQYVLVKRAKLWEVDAHENMFFVTIDTLDQESLQDLVSFMKSEAISLVDAKPNHMTTYLSLVIIADEISDEVRRQVRRTKFRKNFKAGLWGWCDLRVAAVDVSDKIVVANSFGKELKKTLEKNVEVSSSK